MNILDRLRQKKELAQQVEMERDVMRHIEEKEINPNEREVMHYREKARQEAIKDELRAWKKHEMNQYNKMTMLNNDYYFRENSLANVPNVVNVAPTKVQNLFLLGGKKK